MTPFWSETQGEPALAGQHRGDSGPEASRPQQQQQQQQHPHPHPHAQSSSILQIVAPKPVYSHSIVQLQVSPDPLSSPPLSSSSLSSFLPWSQPHQPMIQHSRPPSNIAGFPHHPHPPLPLPLVPSTTTTTRHSNHPTKHFPPRTHSLAKLDIATASSPSTSTSTSTTSSSSNSLSSGSFSSHSHGLHGQQQQQQQPQVPFQPPVSAPSPSCRPLPTVPTHVSHSSSRRTKSTSGFPLPPDNPNVVPVQGLPPPPLQTTSPQGAAGYQLYHPLSVDRLQSAALSSVASVLAGVVVAGTPAQLEPPEMEPVGLGALLPPLRQVQLPHVQAQAGIPPPPPPLPPPLPLPLSPPPPPPPLSLAAIVPGSSPPPFLQSPPPVHPQPPLLPPQPLSAAMRVEANIALGPGASTPIPVSGGVSTGAGYLGNSAVTGNSVLGNGSRDVGGGGVGGPGVVSNTGADAIALVRPLPPLPPGRSRKRSNNNTSHDSNFNVLSMPISWASRPVDLNRAVPTSSSSSNGPGSTGAVGNPNIDPNTNVAVGVGIKGRTVSPLYGQQPQQGHVRSNSNNLGGGVKVRSRPPSRLSPHPPSRPSSRPASPPLPHSPPSPPSSSWLSSNINAALTNKLSSLTPSTRTHGSSTSMTLAHQVTHHQRGGPRLRSRSTSRPRNNNTNRAENVLRYDSFAGVGVAMGNEAGAGSSFGSAAPSTTTSTVTAAALSTSSSPTNALVPAPQASRTIPLRQRRATASPLNIIVTQSQPVGQGSVSPPPMKASSPPAIAPQSQSQVHTTRLAISPLPVTPPSHLIPPPSTQSHLHHHGPGHGHSPIPTPTHTPGHTPLHSPLPTPTHKTRHGGVQVSRDLISRAAAVPASLNPNYNYIMSKGVYYVRDKDRDEYRDRRKDKGKERERTDSSATVTEAHAATQPTAVRPLPGMATVSSSRPLPDPMIRAQAAQVQLDPYPPPQKPECAAEVEGAEAKRMQPDDDAESYLSYIDPPEAMIGVHPDLGSLSWGDEEIIDHGHGIGGGDEEPLLVYVDDDFDSSPERGEFATSVSPMRYARPGSDGSVGSGDEDGSDESSDFFSDVDDPYKYNKGRSKRRGRTRNQVPIGLAVDDPAAGRVNWGGGGAGSGASVSRGGTTGDQTAEKVGKKGVRMTGSLGSMRDLIDRRAWKTDKHKGEARTKSMERDGPQRHPHSQAVWPSSAPSKRDGGDGSGGVDGNASIASPVSVASSQSLSPMRYAKRMSVELLDDSSSVGSPISPMSTAVPIFLEAAQRYTKIGRGSKARSVGSGYKRAKKQPWSYQFDYQAAKASSPFALATVGESFAGEDESVRRREEQRKEEEKKREREKETLRSKGKKGGNIRAGRLSEPVKARLSIDVLDIGLLPPPHGAQSQPQALGTDKVVVNRNDVFGVGDGDDEGVRGVGRDERAGRVWDGLSASSAALSFAATAPSSLNIPSMKELKDPVTTPPLSTVSAPTEPLAPTAMRTRTFKVRNP